MARENYKEYTITLNILVNEEADFFEVDNGHNLDTLEQIFEESVYDLTDMKLKYIEVEYMGD